MSSLSSPHTQQPRALTIPILITVVGAAMFTAILFPLPFIHNNFQRDIYDLTSHIFMVVGATSLLYSLSGRSTVFWALLFAGVMLIAARTVDLTEEFDSLQNVLIVGRNSGLHEGFIATSEGLGYVGVLLAFVAALRESNRAVRRAEEEKARAQSLSDELLILARAADSAPQSLLGVDTKGHVRVANRQATHVFQRTSDELCDCKLSDLFTQSSVIDDGLREVCKDSGAPDWGPMITEINLRSGESVAVEVSIGRVSDESGKVVGATLVARSLAGLLESQRALVKSTSLLSGALQGADVGVFIFDIEDNLIEFNPQMERIFGYKRSEVGDLRHFAGMVSDPNDKLVEVLAHDVFGRRAHALFRDLQVTSKSGEKRVCQVSVTPILDESNSVIGTAGIVVDLTEQRRLAAHLNQSQKMESVGRLAGGIAHDFNNILTSVLGYASLLASKESLDTDTREAAKAIERSAAVAADLTRQLLMFARGRQGESREIPVGQILHESVGLVSGGLRRNIEFTVDVADDLPPIQGDPSQYQQIVFNLIVNARDAIEDAGHVGLRASKSPGEAGDHRQGVLLEVEDDGCGMTDDVVERIFEPFYSTKEQGEGYGLGMAVVYGIVESHGGHVTIDTAVGEGTTVRVWLPPSDMAQAPQKLETEDVAGPLATGGTVLVCDDEDLVRKVVRDSLSRLNIEVIESERGESAIEILADRGEEINMLILDLVMPGMGGAETLRQVRLTYPNLPILIASGYGVESLDAGTVNGTTVTFLQKPFLPSVLQRRVSELIREN